MALMVPLFLCGSRRLEHGHLSIKRFEAPARRLLVSRDGVRGIETIAQVFLPLGDEPFLKLRIVDEIEHFAPRQEPEFLPDVASVPMHERGECGKKDELQIETHDIPTTLNVPDAAYP